MNRSSYTIVIAAMLGIFVLYFSCYNFYTWDRDIETEEGIIECSNEIGVPEHYYKALVGTYYIVSTVDSLMGDEVEIKRDGTIVFYDHAYSNNWAIWNYDSLKIVPRGTHLEINSKLECLNGELYFCINNGVILPSHIKLLKK